VRHSLVISITATAITDAVDSISIASSRHILLSSDSSLLFTISYLIAHSFSCASNSIWTLSSGSSDIFIYAAAIISEAIAGVYSVFVPLPSPPKYPLLVLPRIFTTTVNVPESVHGEV